MIGEYVLQINYSYTLFCIFVVFVTGRIQFQNPIGVFIFRNSLYILFNLSTERACVFLRVIKRTWYSSLFWYFFTTYCTIGDLGVYFLTTRGGFCTIFLPEPWLIYLKKNQQFQKVIPSHGCSKHYFQQEPDATFSFLLFNFTAFVLFSFFMLALHSHLT